MLDTDAMWGYLGFLNGIDQGFYERPIVFLSFFVVWLFDLCRSGWDGLGRYVYWEVFHMFLCKPISKHVNLTAPLSAWY